MSHTSGVTVVKEVRLQSLLVVKGCPLLKSIDIPTLPLSVVYLPPPIYDELRRQKKGSSAHPKMLGKGRLRTVPL